MRPLMSRYPDFYRGSQEFADLQGALEPELEALWDARDDMMAQLDVETATWGLRYWEQTLGIPVEEAKPVDYRRSRVKAKLRGAGVTTVAMIRDVAESYSNGAVAVLEHPADYRLDIKFVGTVGIPPNLEDLTDALREILPAHLWWDYIIVYNTHNVLAGYTHAQLAGHTQLALREEALDGNADESLSAG